MVTEHMEAIQKAKSILDQAGVVGFPTETVYGLAARIDLPEAVRRIFTTKERPFFDPLIVHVYSLAQAKTLTSHWGKISEALAGKFWPGPLTLVLPRSENVNPMITSGLESVGIRMPAHTVALEILREVNVPLAAPSANKFGKTSPTKAEHVRSEFSAENVFVVDGGDCTVGIESTVLLVKENGMIPQLSILRKGAILQSEISNFLNSAGLAHVFTDKVDKKESPGHMKHHYMPAIPFILVKKSDITMDEILHEVNQQLAVLPDEIESIKIFKPSQGVKSAEVLNLSADSVIAAREFYHSLRRAAESGQDCIVFYKTPLHEGDRWEPLFDRLTKAASLVIE